LSNVSIESPARFAYVLKSAKPEREVLQSILFNAAKTSFPAVLLSLKA